MESFEEMEHFIGHKMKMTHFYRHRVKVTCVIPLFRHTEKSIGWVVRHESHLTSNAARSPDQIMYTDWNWKTKA